MCLQQVVDTQEILVLSYSAPVRNEHAPSGGGGAGFIYGPGGNGGYVPNHYGPQYPSIPSQKLAASPGGGGIKGNGGFSLALHLFHSVRGLGGNMVLWMAIIGFNTKFSQ